MSSYPCSKPIVLAIHGSASTAKQWRSLADGFSSTTTFIAPDLPGYGTAANDKGSRLAALEKAIARSPAPIHLVAHSFGGAVALKFSNALPKRIVSVTLYDPVTALEDTSGQPGLSPELDAVWRDIRDGSDTALMQAFLAFWDGPASWEALSETKRVRLVSHAPGLRRDFSEVSRGIWSLDQISYRGPLTILRGTRSPAVIIGMAQAIAARHRQAVIKPLGNLGHLAPLTHPDVVNRHLCQSLAVHGVELTPAIATKMLAA